MKRLLILGAVASLLLSTGCGEPNRDERVAEIAQTGCDRFDACGEIGSGGRFDTYSECVSDLEGTFYDLWPADECSEGQINENAYETCVDRANNFPCDSNVFDQLSFAASCGEGDVCIDPRD